MLIRFRKRSNLLLVTPLLLCASACGGGSTTLSDRVPGPQDAISISGPFDISARARVDTTTATDLVSSVTIANRGTGPEQVTYGGCWISVQLYPTAARVGQPAFNNMSPDVACVTPQIKLTIAQSDSATLTTSIPISFIRSLGAPAGHYFVTLQVLPNQLGAFLSAGDVVLNP